MSASSLNVRGVIRFFGGPAQLSRSATRHEANLTVGAIEKWQQRGQIPGRWIVRLSHLAKQQGRIFDISDFTNTTKGASR